MTWNIIFEWKHIQNLLLTKCCYRCIIIFYSISTLNKSTNRKNRKKNLAWKLKEQQKISPTFKIFKIIMSCIYFRWQNFFNLFYTLSLLRYMLGNSTRLFFSWMQIYFWFGNLHIFVLSSEIVAALMLMLENGKNIVYLLSFCYLIFEIDKKNKILLWIWIFLMDWGFSCFSCFLCFFVLNNN